MVQSAIITPVLAAGSTTSPYIYQINITQRLCSKACSENPPVFQPQFSLVSVSALGEGTYVATIQVQGIISYSPCGNSGCCFKTQPLSQTFTIPFTSDTYPEMVKVAVEGGTVNTISTAACQSCSRTFVSETPISIGVSGAAAAGN